MPYLRLLPSVGLWAIASGVTVAALSIGRTGDGVAAGELVIICGVMVLLSSLLCREIRKTNRPADVAFKEGYEMGHDKGWREGYAAAQPLAVVHRLGKRGDGDAMDGETAERAVPGRLARRGG